MEIPLRMSCHVDSPLRGGQPIYADFHRAAQCRSQTALLQLDVKTPVEAPRETSSPPNKKTPQPLRKRYLDTGGRQNQKKLPIFMP